MRIVFSVLFAIAWCLAHLLWAGLQFVGTLMANDSGSASSDQHLMLIGGVFTGICLTAAAGIPGTLVLLQPEGRSRTLRIFLILLLSGVLLQALAIYFFFSAANP